MGLGVSRSVRRALRVLWAPVVVLTAGACLATRNDVRTLQSDIATLRAETARADSVHRAQAQQAARQVAALADSLRGVNAFLVRFSTDVSRFQGDLTLTMHSFGQQLIALQDLAGLGRKGLQDLRADLETKASELAAAAGPPATSGAGAAPAGPGPVTLIELARGQLNKGSAVTARAGFQDFLEKYPAHELAAEALYGIAESYASEANNAAADSAYQVVVDRFPKSDLAPRALYKRAMIQRRAGQAAKARALFQQLVDKYPGSPEAEIAKENLKAPG